MTPEERRALGSLTVKWSKTDSSKEWARGRKGCARELRAFLDAAECPPERAAPAGQRLLEDPSCAPLTVPDEEPTPADVAQAKRWIAEAEKALGVAPAEPRDRFKALAERWRAKVRERELPAAVMAWVDQCAFELVMEADLPSAAGPREPEPGPGIPVVCEVYGIPYPAQPEPAALPRQGAPPGEPPHWSISADREGWEGRYATREEAVAEAPSVLGLQPGARFWVGTARIYAPPAASADSVIEQAACTANDEVDEVAEGWLERVASKDERALEEALTEVFHAWLRRTGHWPDFWVMDTEEECTVPVAALPAPTAGAEEPPREAPESGGGMGCAGCFAGLPYGIPNHGGNPTEHVEQVTPGHFRVTPCTLRSPAPPQVQARPPETCGRLESDGGGVCDLPPHPGGACSVRISPQGHRRWLKADPAPPAEEKP